MRALINSNSIQHETDKAVLIKIPKTEWGIWHPKRFIKFTGKNDYQMTVWFGDNFKSKKIKLNVKSKIESDEELLSEIFSNYLI